MSPILVRPVREQLEHDRIIRLLQGKFRRKYDAGMNPGAEQNAPVGTGGSTVYPDLVLSALDRGRRLQGVVEIETGESVNHLEALAQWTALGKLRVPFHLYVPAGMVDVARRLCDDNNIYVTEIWSYHIVGDQPRFTLVHRNREAPPAAPRAARTAEPKSKAAKPAKAKPAKAAAKSKAAKPKAAKPKAAKKAAKPKAVKKAKPKRK